MVQSEQHVVYRLQAGGSEAQSDMEETDGEQLS